MPARQRKVHYDIEKQILMDPSPAYDVAAYNEIVIQFGWLIFFSVVFPAAPLFSLISTCIQVQTDLNTMTKF